MNTGTGGTDVGALRHALAAACAKVGVPGGQAAGAALLSFGENAVFAFGDTVARVGRGPHMAARAAREVMLARWLAEMDFPAVRPAPFADAPVLVDSHPVTFWQRLPPADRAPVTTDLAVLLRRLHALPAPPFALPPREPLALLEPWLDAAGGTVTRSDRAFLLDRRAELSTGVASLRPALPPGLIHGDALLRNVGVHGGRALLLDWETAAHDLREMDLALTPLAVARYGLRPDAVGELARVYGFDVTTWPGYDTVRAVRELAATAWVAQHVADNPAARAEFAHRVRCLREGDLHARWHAF